MAIQHSLLETWDTPRLNAPAQPEFNGAGNKPQSTINMQKTKNGGDQANMKKFLVVLLFLLLGVFFMAESSWAFPSLYDITGINGSQGYYDTGAEAVFLTDTDGNNDNAFAAIILEDAGYASTNSLGIYGYTVDINGNIVLGNTLEIFSGINGQWDSQTIWFDAANGLAALSRDSEGNLENPVDIGGTSFGFFLSVPQEESVFYSHKSLNSDDQDHMLLFNTVDYTSENYFLTASHVVIAWEDLLGLGDKDYNDMVVGVSDVSPVPEPETMLLFGVGLCGLAFVARKKLIRHG